METELENIGRDFQAHLAALSSHAEVADLKAKYLGKNGRVNSLLKALKGLTPEEKKQFGPRVQALKESIQSQLQAQSEHMENAGIERRLERDKIDITHLERVQAKGRQHGGYHPRTIVQRDIEDIFLSMGFEVVDGPHIEDEWHNFEALNIPADHPARDMQDTFWFAGQDGEKSGYLLRTHTSNIQVRAMQSRRPPFRFIAPGVVFRNERTDASHEMAFYQLEGMLIDREVSIGHLIYFMQTLLGEIFQRQVKVRLRPGYFPFVEPGFELDIQCFLCKGRGCPVCKQTGWVELLPCGMVHPTVLAAGQIDSQEWNGFAFGLGLDRLVMMKYAIDDIRLLAAADLRFQRQFQLY